MPEVPKIVHSRLRAGGSSAGHPDADLLTAFAEQALSAEEREGVLHHLAVCGDCREVVAIALPASESVLVVQATPETTQAAATTRRQDTARRNWFGWLGLRGVAVAAGVIVAAVLILRPGKQAQPKFESTVAGVSTQAEPPMAETAVAKPAAPSVERAFSDTAKSDELRASKDEARQAKLKSQFSKELRIEPARKPAEMARMQPDAALGDRKRADLGEADKQAPAAAAPTASGAISGKSVSETAGVLTAAQQAPPANEAVTSRAATETVEVSGASPVVQTTDATTNENLSVMARNEIAAPVEKAKPAVKKEETRAMASQRMKKQASGTTSGYVYGNSVQAAPTASWRLSEGVLQHSLDARFTWQTVLRTEHSLLCQAARGSDIWAAGQAGTVFHSTDGGVTWTELHPTLKDQPLTADITGIELQKPGEAVLTTITGERWTTMDNGKTWTMTGTIKK